MVTSRGADPSTPPIDPVSSPEPPTRVRGVDGGAGSQDAGVPSGLPPVFLQGERVAGRFEIRRFLGQGGMGQVFEAWDQELQTLVAVKVVRPDRTDDGSLERRFRAEVEIARRVTHRHVCRVFDLFPVTSSSGDWGEEPTPLLLLTMELIDGENLAEWLARHGAQPLDRALPWIRQMAEALDAAHQAGITHRDFKTSNIVLRPVDGGAEVVVTDFGLARSHGLSPGGTAVGFEGTPDYAAPEVHAGREGDQRSDLYSFGAVTHELLTGVLPAERSGGQRLSRRIERVLDRGLDPDPANRFPSAGAMVAELEPPHRRRRGFGLMALLLLVAVLALVWSRGSPPLSSGGEQTEERWERARTIYRQLETGQGREFDESRRVEALAASGSTTEALRMLAELRSAPELNAERRLRLLMLEAEVAEQAGRFREQRDAARAAGRLARAEGWAADAARAELMAATALYRLGQSEDAAQLARPALARLAEEGDEWSRAEATLRFELPFLYEQDLITPAEGLEIFRAVGDREGEARLLIAEARYRLADHPNPVELEAVVERGLALAREVGSFRAEAEALNLSALLRWSQGDETGSVEGFREALRAAQASGDQRRIAGYTMNLALQLQHLGDSPEIWEGLNQAVEIFRGLGSRGDLSRALANVSRYHRNHGEHEQAVRVAREALAEAEAFGDPWLIQNSWSLLATIFDRTKQFDQAREATETALALARTEEERDWGQLRMARIDRRAGEPARSEAPIREIVARRPLDVADQSLAIYSRLELVSLFEDLGQPEAATELLAEVLPLMLDSGAKIRRLSRARQAARLHLAFGGQTNLPEVFATAIALAETEGRFDDLALAALEQARFLARIERPRDGCQALSAAIDRTEGKVTELVAERLLTRWAACAPGDEAVLVSPAPS